MDSWIRYCHGANIYFNIFTSITRQIHTTQTVTRDLMQKTTLFLGLQCPWDQVVFRDKSIVMLLIGPRNSLRRNNIKGTFQRKNNSSKLVSCIMPYCVTGLARTTYIELLTQPNFWLAHQLKLLANSGITGHTTVSPLDRQVAFWSEHSIDDSLATALG